MYIIKEKSIRATLPELQELTGYPELVKICHQKNKFEADTFTIIRWNYEPNRYELVANKGHEAQYKIFTEHALIAGGKLCGGESTKREPNV